MDFQSKIITESSEMTEQLGAELAKELCDMPALPRFIAMYGDLGVGKTAFVRGFAKYFCPNASVKSPTFALVNEYKSDSACVYHFDMYRVADEDDLYSIGFYDYIDRGFCIVEWSENIPYALPNSYIKVSIEKNSLFDTNSRSIEISVEK